MENEMKQEPDIPKQPGVNVPGVEEKNRKRIVSIRQAAEGSSLYGLAAVSLLTGRPFDLCIRVVRETFPIFKTAPIIGLDESMILAIVLSLGYSATPVSISPPFRDLSPSLAAMLCVLRNRRERTYLIVESGCRHCLVLKGRKIYDSYCPGGIWIRKYPFRKLKVGSVWMVQNPIKQYSLPFEETPKGRRGKF